MKSERELIRHIAALASEIAPAPARSAVIRGIGDDCAVLRLGPGSDTLITTDLFVEGVHFRRHRGLAEQEGLACARRGLSDIAAMGGEAVAIFLSLGVPKDLSDRWLSGFLAGFLALCRRYRVTLAGGDTGSSLSGFFADVSVLGRVPTGKAILRRGAKVGDLLYVTGELGFSAVNRALNSDPEELLGRYGFYVCLPDEMPPRLNVGFRLRGLASAMIDVSDGLSTDLSHICEESGVGAIVFAPAIPRLPFPQGEIPGANLRWSGWKRSSKSSSISEVRAFEKRSLELALHGGEDYELLFTAARNKKVPSEIAGVPITRIGEITADKGKMFLVDEHGRMKRLEPKGWEHFTAHGRPKSPAVRGKSSAGNRGKR